MLMLGLVLTASACIPAPFQLLLQIPPSADSVIAPWPFDDYFRLGDQSAFTLVLSRDDDGTSFHGCRLTVSFDQRFSAAYLQCRPGTTPELAASPLIRPLALGPDEARFLTRLAERSKLYAGERVGDAPTGGTIETLTIRHSRESVVFVTSGNPSFADDPSRRGLLAKLREIEGRMRLRVETAVSGVP
jgi:hypothetical protein